MRTAIILIFALLSGAALAQTPAGSNLKGQPIEITSTGGTTYEGGVAIARDNVAIHVGDTDIYADHARYNTATKVVEVEGNVRIYRGAELYVGDSGTYNTETREINADKLRTIDYPFFLSGDRITTISENAKLVQKGSFTTHDSATPDFQIRSTTVRVYEGDRVILKNATFYVGRIPIFYWPYLYQSLDDSFSFVISPAYTSVWGPTLLGRVTFPISENIKATVRLDYRARRGPAIGFNPEIKFGKKKTSYAKLRTYFVQDQNPIINRTSLPRSLFPDERYRVGFENRTNFTKDITAFVNISKISDPFFLQDFFPSEFQVNPQPDNLISINRHHPNYSLTAFTRFQVNDFYEATERLPEVALDIRRQPVFGTPIFYEGEASLSNLHRNFEKDSLNNDYDTLRLDTFHQFLYPNTYFGWLSVVPRVGFRGTYYTDTRDLSNVTVGPDLHPLVPDFVVPLPTSDKPLLPGGDRFRVVVNAGAEASFKVSRTWEKAQSRLLGLDGLRHIVQPFANYSYVTGNNTNPAEILQFDRYVNSTRLRPIDFPQFTSIDSIDNWSIARIGVRNRLQTRRDDSTINWMELETYFDANIDNPYDANSFSNLYNNLRFNPVPWFSFGVNSQIPLVAGGFTEVNTDFRFQPTASFQFGVSHRFLSETPFFPDSSLYYFGAYYRFNDHWGAGAAARYEANTGFIEEQRYTLYRDLTSWIASIGGVIRNNGGIKEYGVLLSFTLKALPKFSFDLNFDPSAAQAQGQEGGGFLPVGP